MDILLSKEVLAQIRSNFGPRGAEEEKLESSLDIFQVCTALREYVEKQTMQKQLVEKGVLSESDTINRFSDVSLKEYSGDAFGWDAKLAFEQELLAQGAVKHDEYNRVQIRYLNLNTYDEILVKLISRDGEEVFVWFGRYEWFRVKRGNYPSVSFHYNSYDKERVLEIMVHYIRGDYDKPFVIRDFHNGFKLFGLNVSASPVDVSYNRYEFGEAKYEVRVEVVTPEGNRTMAWECKDLMSAYALLSEMCSDDEEVQMRQKFIDGRRQRGWIPEYKLRKDN